MTFFNYQIGELAALATVITLLFSFVGWIFKISVTKPLNDAITELRKTIDRLDQRNSTFDIKLDNHETIIQVHEQRITANEARIKRLEEHSK